MSNWGLYQAGGLGGFGATSQGGAGGGYKTPAGYHSELDARRSMAPRLPQAEHPDGYLGTITDRRQDRLLQAVNSRLTSRSYQRGVHVGSRIDPQGYLWDDAVLTPTQGLEAQAKGTKWTAQGAPVERLAHMGKVAFTTPEQLGRIAAQYGVDPGLADPTRAASLTRFRPPWQ